MKRHPDEKVFYALFDDPKEMEHAFDQLLAAGISIDDVSLLFAEDTPDEEFKPLVEKRRTLGGATAGGIFGATLGGIFSGMLAGAVANPVGIVVFGPAIALAATGGLLGGLAGHAVRSLEAERLHQALESGQALMAVHAHAPRELEIAERLLRREARQGHAETVTPAA